MDNIIFTRIWEDADFYEARVQFIADTITVSCQLYLTESLVNGLAQGINAFIQGEKKKFVWNVRNYDTVDSSMLELCLKEKSKQGHAVMQVNLRNDKGVTATLGIRTELGILHTFANRIQRLNTISVGGEIALIENNN